MKGLGWAIALAPAAFAGAAQAGESPSRPRWYVETSRQHCTLMRETGGPEAATVAFRVVPGTLHVQMTALDRGWKAAPIKDKDPVTVAFDVGAPFRTKAELLSSRDHDAVVGRFDRSLLETMGGASAVQLLSEGKPVLSVPLPAAAKALAALQGCEDAMLRRWGVDPAARAALKRHPQPHRPLGTLASEDDYPAAGPLRNAQGLSVVRLTVGADGKVSNCTVVAGSNFEVLNARTCAIYTSRASFEPALGADGAPAVSEVVTYIHWRMVRS